MLYSNASMPAAAVQPVVQPRRNSTEIIFRRGTSHNMPEPFRSHEGGTLQFAVVHPAVMQQCNFKEEVYHRLDKGFNFQGRELAAGPPGQAEAAEGGAAGGGAAAAPAAPAALETAELNADVLAGKSKAELQKLLLQLLPKEAPAPAEPAALKEEVYHRLDKGFNFQGIQSLGENALGKSQGVTANNMPSTSAAATAEEPIVIPDDNENVNLVPAGKKLKRKGKSFIHEEAEEEEEDEVPEEVLLRAFTKRKGKGKARA
eukprot:CAMPEP_0118848952 /NCGR_PEP_ID=MMETSP1162-20130426/93721_1 /TAXON_ID=33656 /ORGANISM="Phaeocystis Sp, Strain CCMP2710" /LENGTH=258 /DNA_ID=CAMNT_0006781143 /DNA_START=128 /DNA_END=906 /DNA_ORIENTATION=-